MHSLDAPISIALSDGPQLWQNTAAMWAGDTSNIQGRGKLSESTAHKSGSRGDCQLPAEYLDFVQIPPPTWRSS